MGPNELLRAAVAEQQTWIPSHSGGHKSETQVSQGCFLPQPLSVAGRRRPVSSRGRSCVRACVFIASSFSPSPESQLHKLIGTQDSRVTAQGSGGVSRSCSHLCAWHPGGSRRFGSKWWCLQRADDLRMLLNLHSEAFKSCLRSFNRSIKDSRNHRHDGEDIFGGDFPGKALGSQLAWSAVSRVCPFPLGKIHCVQDTPKSVGLFAIFPPLFRLTALSKEQLSVIGGSKSSLLLNYASRNLYQGS
ncbi:uncharacterized protein LOC141582849 [Saimiri boliviensis]|uniref:uncharacterized protein LOC141582849 n=1 Tax=Saimiri boliviensis TaxID=27679 RepID=UPI003D7774E2